MSTNLKKTYDPGRSTHKKTCTACPPSHTNSQELTSSLKSHKQMLNKFKKLNEK